jgi:hypothetical protein
MPEKDGKSAAWTGVRRFVIALAGFGTLVAAFYVVENWRGRRAFAVFAAAAKTAGVSLNLIEHAPRPVPDAENFAKTPLFNAPLTNEANTGYWQPLEKRVTLRRSNGQEFFLSNQYLADWALARRSDWTALQAKATDVDLDAELRRLAPELAEVAAAAEGPFARYPAEFEKTYGMRLWHIGPLRRLSELLALRATLALERDDAAAAGRDVHTLLRLVHLDRDQPMLISQFIRAHLLRLALSVIWEGALRRSWQAPELASFATDLARIDFLQGARAAYAAECAALTTAVLGVLDDPKARDELIRSLRNDNTALNNPVLRSIIPRGWWLQNVAVAGQVVLDQRVATIDPAHRRVNTGRGSRDAIDAALAERFSGFTVMARITTPTYMTPQLAHAQTAVDLARWAVALERYRLERGEYPETLDPLSTTAGELGALRDVIDGAPYRYRREAGGFRLWSSGWDHRDDDGQRGQSKNSGGDLFTGDWVWVRS